MADAGTRVLSRDEAPPPRTPRGECKRASRTLQCRLTHTFTRE
jgi:hypothetical protein